MIKETLLIFISLCSMHAMENVLGIKDLFDQAEKEKREKNTRIEEENEEVEEENDETLGVRELFEQAEEEGKTLKP